MISTHFKNQTQVVPKILSNHCKKKHKSSSRFFQIMQKSGTSGLQDSVKLLQIISTRGPRDSFKLEPRDSLKLLQKQNEKVSRDSFKLLPKQNTNISKTRQGILRFF